MVSAAILLSASPDELEKLNKCNQKSGVNNCADASKQQLLGADESDGYLSVRSLPSVCCTIFVVLGVGQAISIRSSTFANEHFHYDVSAAVTACEFLKLSFCMVWIMCFNRDSMPRAMEIPTPWLHDSFTLFIVAIFFAIQNQLAFAVVERLGPSLFMILGNMKIVFTCIFMRLILDRRFSFLQWVAVGMLTLSAVLLKLPVFLEVFQSDSEVDGVHDLIVGMLLMLMATSSSGLSSVVNEFILKKETEGAQMPFMAKNAVLYFWGVVLNLMVWLLVGELPFFSWIPGRGLLPILCMTGMGLACSVILRYLDNMYRCFAACAQVLLTLALARFVLPPELQDEPLDIFYVCSVLLLAQALVIYQNSESPQLGWYITLVSIGAGFVCMICMGLDGRHGAATTIE